MHLSDIELRVLGVLMEKALTQPAGYPMTLNAITLGANQKQNRDPVLEHSEGDVSGALRTLEHKGLVVRAEASIGARAVRFKHLVVEKFKWDKREQAVMAEFILRGRQTAGELRTRASRMTPLPDLQAVGTILDHLKTTQPPYVEELPREPGRSANRFRHLLGGTDSAQVSRSVAPPPSAARTPSGTEEGSLSRAAAHAPADSDLASRVSALETQVSALRTALNQLQARIGEASFGTPHPPPVIQQ
jgi:uncharacterized protein YceH (UPF0502 family)